MRWIHTCTRTHAYTHMGVVVSFPYRTHAPPHHTTAAVAPCHQRVQSEGVGGRRPVHVVPCAEWAYSCVGGGSRRIEVGYAEKPD